MRTLLLFFFNCFFFLQLNGQCLTDFTKVIPESSPDYSTDFGRAISMKDDFLAVGVPNSDSVGRITGLVYIYKKDGTKWVRNAAIVPTIPLDGLQFGWSVKLSKDYLFVGARSQGGSVYVFRRNGGDWNNFSELAIWKVPDAKIFGTWQNNPIEVTEDQNTVAITDIGQTDNSFPMGSSGAIYLYHKGVSEEWGNSSTPLVMPPPEVDVDEFGGGGILFQGNRMATFARYAPTANGRIYVYQDAVGEFDNPTLEAKLGAGPLSFSYGFSNLNFAFTQDGIFLMASVDVSTSDPKYEVAFFEQPQSGAWSDGYLTCHFDPDLDNDSSNSEPTVFTSSGNDLVIASRKTNNVGTLTYLKKGNGGWCNPVRETIEVSYPNPSTLHNYGEVITSNGNLDVVLGYVSNPAIGITEVALKTFTKTGNGWEVNYLSKVKKSTAGHYFGRKILGTGDNLFVSAPYDGTVKANAGAVYVYTKGNTGWNKTNKILPPAGGQYDDVFASNMATSGDYLTVAAAGHSPNGKFFVYKKGTDWNNPQLIQVIDLKDDGLIVFTSGDYVAMSQEWLVIPYLDSPGSNSMEECHIFLAIYKFNGSTFQFHQSMCLQGANFFARSSTVAVSIEGNLIVAGSKIVELNELGTWEVKYQLYPSESEPIQFNPDLNLITNGDRFGFSNYIHNGTIFISAPTKDHNGIWDVGAVYVYAKLPDEAWSSRSESAIILPHVKDESGLFGYSLAAFENTLIVGTPVNDFNKTGAAINKPGRASIFQAENYYWTDTKWIADFTGDSFVKDYFGMAVHMDETDFFMGAPIEDLETGKISGSVYMVPTPPIVKLVPPICNTENTITLFGYPFQGTWSGPGIVDGALGTFDPSVAGLGVHELTYRTPNCANVGTLKVDIREGFLIEVLTEKEFVVCQTTNPIGIDLEIQARPEETYQWYYRAETSGLFQPLELTTSKIVATKTGEYQVQATNALCLSLSPIITIKNENVELIVDQLPPSCNTATTAIPLTASPSGGTWTGIGVTNNQFFSSGLAAGVYPLTYFYTSSNGCNYSKAVSSQVVAPFIPVLVKVGDICLNGSATIRLSTTPVSPTTIQWLTKDINEVDYTLIQNEGKSINIDGNGSVKVITETTYCSPQEATININDSFNVTFLPSEEEIKICPNDGTYLNVASNRTGLIIDWNFYETNIEEVTIINSTSQIRPNQTGYYFAVVTSGNCQTTTSTKHVTIQPSDSVFIPNVLTPNGDGRNDMFKIVTNTQYPSYEIFNRYGESIYLDEDNSGWNGQNLPSGVYFYLASVTAICESKKVSYKGWIQLVR